jgi:hypothetical protein
MCFARSRSTPNGGAITSASGRSFMSEPSGLGSDLTESLGLAARDLDRSVDRDSGCSGSHFRADGPSAVLQLKQTYEI